MLPSLVTVLLTVALAATGLTGGSAAQAARPMVRGTWVWEVTDPVDLVADAVRRDVRQLVVHVTPGVAAPGERAALAELAPLARAAGIDLQALGGDPSWVLDPAAALAWQRSALATGHFSGAHVDIEPWLLPGWGQRKTRDRYVAGLVDVVARLQADSPRPLEVDLPFWAHEVPWGKRDTLADGVLARADAVTVMSYRDSAAGIRATGAPVLALAAAAGRPARLGAETRPLADCAHCTFAEEGAGALVAALAEVDATETSPAYAGVVVHDAVGWSRLESPAR